MAKRKNIKPIKSIKPILNNRIDSNKLDFISNKAFTTKKLGGNITYLDEYNKLIKIESDINNQLKDTTINKFKSNKLKGNLIRNRQNINDLYNYQYKREFKDNDMAKNKRLKNKRKLPNQEVDLVNMYYNGGAVSGAVTAGVGMFGNMFPPDPLGGQSLGSHMFYGAAKGAAAGATFGPVGAAIGGVLGAGAGLLGNSKEDKLLSEQNRIAKSQNINAFANGGEINTMFLNNFLMEYDNGGSHEGNPNGGIQIGMGENGQPNFVEEGETRWEDYIFSDRLKFKNPEAFKLPTNLKNKTFADASKEISKEGEERPYDLISKRGKQANMNKLIGASDQAKEIEQMKTAGNSFGGGGPLDFEFGSQRPNNQLNAGAFNQPEQRAALLRAYSEQIQGGTKLSVGDNSYDISNTPNFLPPISNVNEENKVSSDILSQDFGMQFAQANRDINNKEFSGNNNSDFLTNAIRYSPVAYNAIAGMTLKKPDQVNLSRPGRDLASKYGYTPKYLDETMGTGRVNTAYGSALSSIKDASGGNAAAVRAGITGSVPGFLKGREDLYSKIQRDNANQYAMSQQSKGQLGMQGATLDANMEVKEEDINAANMGAYTTNKYNLLGEAASGLGGIGTENYWGEIAPRVSGGYDQRGRYHRLGGLINILKKARHGK